jgi:hypothetical protein
MIQVPYPVCFRGISLIYIKFVAYSSQGNNTVYLGFLHCLTDSNKIVYALSDIVNQNE